MKKTQNLEMNIPEGGDPINITDITDNFETLDTEMAKKANSSGGDISNTTVKTVDTIAADFPVPSAGESSKTFLGKVRKFIQDFIAIKDTLLTLSKLVNNGQTTASGFALDARYGKTLYDLYAQLNSNLIVSGGDINITGSDFSAGIIYYQNVGRISILSFGGLQFINSFPSGTTIRLITLNNGSWPLVTTKSVIVCQNIPLYLTITTAGEIILANYSGISVPAGATAEGQVSYVTSLN